MLYRSSQAATHTVPKYPTSRLVNMFKRRDWRFLHQNDDGGASSSSEDESSEEEQIVDDSGRNKGAPE